MNTEAGDVDLILMFFLVASVQIVQFSVLHAMALAWQTSYQSLETELNQAQENPEPTFRAFGLTLKTPLPRIDYGAYYQKNRDAEALCIIGRENLLPADFARFRCE
ncbi:MAG: hypothetical protein H7249_20565 [Chitinophagaceae bacterium]|nr:hypothetical protein [Oligoflexus sp.]